MIKLCAQCQKELTGKQTTYCSRSCLMKYTRHRMFYEQKPNGKFCMTCNKELLGRQNKTCSNKCKCALTYALDKTTQNKKSYKKQQDRAKIRKHELINMKGSKCEICSYNKNTSALVFHHIDPHTKEFTLDSRSLSNRTYDSILIEAEKCQLLCSNCHAEIHNPTCAI